MSVYIVTDGKYFKIGYTDGAVEARIDALQTGNPNRLILVHQMDGGRALEKELHGAYAAKRLSGEWFDLTNKDLKSIKETFCPACGSRRMVTRQEVPMSNAPSNLPLLSAALAPVVPVVEEKPSRAGVPIPSEIPSWQVPRRLCQPIDGEESISGHAVVVDPSWLKVQAICVGHDVSVALGEDVVRLVFRPLLHGAMPWRGFIYWQLELGGACVDKTLTTLKHLGWQTPDFEILMANDIGSSGLGGRSHDLAIGLGLNNSHEVKGILKGLTF